MGTAGNQIPSSHGSTLAMLSRVSFRVGGGGGGGAFAPPWILSAHPWDLKKIH